MKEKKIHIDTLVLEGTKKCNMHCAHCIRGDSQNSNISTEVIDSVLERTASIGTIVFSGGEPTLNVHAIRYALDVVKEFEIPVYAFYIVTNGKFLPKEFLQVLLDWYVYCISCGGEPDICGVALSKDMFHETIPRENELILEGFSFFRGEDKKTDFRKIPVISRGRAKFLVGVPKRELDCYDISVTDETDSKIALEGDVYVTTEGYILPFCDNEYAEQRKQAIGSVFAMQEFIDNLRSECFAEAQ